MAKVKLSASVNALGCTVLVPLILHQYKYVHALCMFCLLHECFCIMWVALEYKSQHISDEKMLLIFLKDL